MYTLWQLTFYYFLSVLAPATLISTTIMATTTITRSGVVGTPIPVELVTGLLSALVVILIVVVIGTLCLATMITKKKRSTVRNLQTDVLSRYQDLKDKNSREKSHNTISST